MITILYKRRFIYDSNISYQAYKDGSDLKCNQFHMIMIIINKKSVSTASSFFLAARLFAMSHTRIA